MWVKENRGNGNCQQTRIFRLSLSLEIIVDDALSLSAKHLLYGTNPLLELHGSTLLLVQGS
ncbi:hypothetical protein TorRG33x02_276810 [Trema orientale]|uniref:Uncharacterized protein n=1 Tax=Trema orientale TaxID=63057 RepID=A0A2P5CQH3_TREOI|nr:hypothetical protein TorRG33x02_276810 [Trema orientale]